jgi:hypothetical protein
VVPESGLAVFQGCALGGNTPVPGWDTKQLVTEVRGLLRSWRITQPQLCFVGACGTKGDMVPTAWYSQWGLTSRDNCQISNRFGNRAKLVAPGEWLAIGPQRACSDHKAYDTTYRKAFCFAMHLAAIRFGATVL